MAFWEEGSRHSAYGQKLYHHVFDEMPLTQTHQKPLLPEMPPYSPSFYVLYHHRHPYNHRLCHCHIYPQHFPPTPPYVAQQPYQSSPNVSQYMTLPNANPPPNHMQYSYYNGNPSTITPIHTSFPPQPAISTHYFPDNQFDQIPTHQYCQPHHKSLTSHPYTIPHTPTHEHQDQHAWQMQTPFSSAFERPWLIVEPSCQMQASLGFEVQLQTVKELFDGGTTTQSDVEHSSDWHTHMNHISLPQFSPHPPANELPLTPVSDMAHSTWNVKFDELCQRHNEKMEAILCNFSKKIQKGKKKMFPGKLNLVWFLTNVTPSNENENCVLDLKNQVFSEFSQTKFHQNLVANEEHHLLNKMSPKEMDLNSDSDQPIKGMPLEEVSSKFDQTSSYAAQYPDPVSIAHNVFDEMTMKGINTFKSGSLHVEVNDSGIDNHTLVPQNQPLQKDKQTLEVRFNNIVGEEEVGCGMRSIEKYGNSVKGSLPPPSPIPRCSYSDRIHTTFKGKGCIISGFEPKSGRPFSD